MYPEVQEDFPNKQQLISALLLALATGVMGFLVSYSIFIKHDHRPVTGNIDRKAAEGYAARVRKAQKSNPHQTSVTHLAYRRYSKKKYQERQPKDNQEYAKARKRNRRRIPVAKTEKPKPQPSKTPPKLASNTSRGSTRSSGGRDAGTLYMPEVGQRPSEMSAMSAWSKASVGIVRFPNIRGDYTNGVLIGKNLVAAKNSALSPYSLSNIDIGGATFQGRVTNTDEDLDLALVSITGSFDGLPLCPEAPDLGTDLYFRNAKDFSPSNFHEARPMGSAGPGAFFFEGNAPYSASGSPLINRRGEVVGLILGRLRGYPGNNYNVAVDSAALARLLRVSTAATTSTDPVVRFCTRGLTSEVPEVVGRERPTRSNSKVIPGQTLGNYPLGLTEAQLTGELGTPERRQLNNGVTRLTFSAQKLTFTLVSGRTVAVETDYNFYNTEKGLSIGTFCDRSRLSREFGEFRESPDRKGKIIMTPGLELDLDQEGKVTQFVLVPKII